MNPEFKINTDATNLIAEISDWIDKVSGNTFTQSYPIWPSPEIMVWQLRAKTYLKLINYRNKN